MVKRLEIRYSDTTSSTIDNNFLAGMRDYYMSRYGTRMSVVWGGARTLYKFGGVTIETRTIRKKKTERVTMKNKIPDIDISRLVILGGTFEEIGGKDEAIGGGNQKVGSDIQ